jgi:hypothetical protein
MLLILVLGIFIIAVAGGVYIWIRAHDVDDTHKSDEGAPQSLVQSNFRNEPVTVTVYYPVQGMLLAGTAEVKRQPDTQAQARETLAAVFNDQRAAQTAVFRDIKLKAFYLDGQGTAYVDLDLTSSRQRNISASAWEEFLALSAMVNTVMQNFDEIKQVRFLVDGREAKTLAGHMDLSRSYTKRMDLVKQQLPS